MEVKIIELMTGDVLKPSDVIIPPADLTLEGGEEDFQGEGLVPD